MHRKVLEACIDFQGYWKKSVNFRMSQWAKSP